MLNILFWGTGSYAIKWIECNQSLFDSIESKKFIDKNHVSGKKKQFLECEIITPEEIQTENYDYICIISSFLKEIREEAIKYYNISEEKIITVKELSNLIIEKLYGFNKEKRFEKRILLNHLAEQNFNIISLLKDYYDYEKLKVEYKNYIDFYPIENYSKDNIKDEKKIIWICWFEGYDDAPDIVKACINSVKKIMSNYEIILITKENMEKYIKFPDYILEKYQKGLITNTHFSDLLRLELLICYGGIWIDATVVITKKIPLFIQNAPLFLFNFNRQESIEPRTVSSWFIVAKPQNKILILTKNLLYLYWQKNDYLLNYFLLHYFFRMSSEKFIKEWKDLIHIVENTNILWDNLFEKFDKKKYDFINNISFCQKISYKMKVPDNTKGTFYEAILNKYLKGEKNVT